MTSQAPIGIGRGMARFPPPSETSSMYDDQESEIDIAPLRRPGQVAPTVGLQSQRAPIHHSQQATYQDIPREPPTRQSAPSVPLRAGIYIRLIYTYF